MTVRYDGVELGEEKRLRQLHRGRLLGHGHQLTVNRNCSTAAGGGCRVDLAVVDARLGKPPEGDRKQWMPGTSRFTLFLCHVEEGERGGLECARELQELEVLQDVKKMVNVGPESVPN